ncbi:MAG: FdhD protein [Gaiellales bacterium]|jgi:FdhD protein|nr:FdhD protein [Gaiellales bacterium]
MAATERPPLRGASVEARVLTVARGVGKERRDRLAGEEPLEIRAAGPGQGAARVAVTMRTPGHDFELAAGFLHSEGLLSSPRELREIKYCTDVELREQAYNVVTVHLRRPFQADLVQRNFGVTSACGVCGKASIDSIEVASEPLPEGPVVAAAVIAGLPERLRTAQRTFERTGGSHATGLFTAAGELELVREDVGRHNALDKVIGNRMLAGATPLGGSVALVSGRASFELVQKAAVAGIPILCAVGAPSSLAVDAARRLGLTLVGFLRDDRFNIYAGASRIALAAP